MMAHGGPALAELPKRLIVGRPVNFAGQQPDHAGERRLVGRAAERTELVDDGSARSDHDDGSSSSPELHDDDSAHETVDNDAGPHDDPIPHDHDTCAHNDDTCAHYHDHADHAAKRHR